MPTAGIIGIIAVLVVAALAYVAYQAETRRRLRSRFGTEYDRAMRGHENQRAAERELRTRLRRHRALDIRELSPEERDRCVSDWADVRQQFVDSPEQAVEAARHLVESIADERGYDRRGGEDHWLADLSVDHADGVGHYRSAIGDSGGDDPTEAMRRALLHYQAMLDDLVGGSVEPGIAPATRHGSPLEYARQVEHTVPAERNEPAQDKGQDDDEQDDEGQDDDEQDDEARVAPDAGPDDGVGPRLAKSSRPR